MTPRTQYPIPNTQYPRSPLTFLLLATCFWLLTSPTAARADDPIPPQVQTAVDRGLTWLAANQNPTSGKWETREPTVAVADTSLAAMAFMARGHVPGQGPYGQNLNHAIDAVLAEAQPSGLLAPNAGNHSMYCHGIATVMLCDAYGMLDDTRQAKAKIAIAQSVRLILDAQKLPKAPNHKGGWRYKPTARDSDLSVTVWQLMALRGASNIGADVPEAPRENGRKFVESCATPSGAFSYPGRTDAALTGAGILALELLGHHLAPQSVAGGDYLLQHLDDRHGNEFYFYTVYYCSQAAWQLGGRYWENLNPLIRKSVLDRQAPNGSWPVPAGPEQVAGTPYGTSMAILALTVPYRYLPIYQR